MVRQAAHTPLARGTKRSVLTKRKRRRRRTEGHVWRSKRKRGNMEVMIKRNEEDKDSRGKERG